jgi:class 3 adenylate cyclase
VNLFSDVVASTELDRALGDRRWRAVLDAHDQLTTAQVERHRGRVVKSTGDGCLAVFDGPQAAVAAALAVRETCAELGLRLRLGIHAGEAEHRGDDLAGISVHIAARVMAEAEPGQILVTRTV